MGEILSMNGQTRGYMISHIILAEVFLEVRAIAFSQRVDNFFQYRSTVSYKK